MFIPQSTSHSELRSTDFTETQPWCNFVLFSPTHLPNGMEITDRQLRTESSNGFSSYRFHITGGGRTLSIKQFLYDWAPPAYDHPSLWRNAKISQASDTPLPKPFLIKQDVAWVGLNFRRQRAASLHMKRTMIEMTVIEGDFDDEELIHIFRNLRPISEVSMQKILSTPFACLCKAYRHNEKASPVPLSYWKHTRKDSESLLPVVPSPSTTPPIQLPKDYTYQLNSLFLIGEPPIETEYYYEKNHSPGSYIRLLVTKAGAELPIAYPPKLGDQTCKTQILNINGINVYHAYLTEEFGPHELVWNHNGMNMLLLIKPTNETTLDWCHQFIVELLHFVS